MKKKFADCVIADADLAAYLADKLTTRPHYGEHEPKDDEQDVLSRWKAAQEAEKKNREASNKSAGKGLKR